MIIEPMLAEVCAALLANRMRAFLTTLGMVIGVGAVILMVAIGSGAQYSINSMIASMGSNLIMVLSGSATSGGMRMGFGALPTLTNGDAEAIAELPHVLAVSPFANGAAQMVYGSNNWSTVVYGVTSDYFNIQNWNLEQGSYFTNADVRSATRVTVVGQTAAKNLFGDENPVGKIVRISKNPYLILGLLEKKGQSIDGRDQDDSFYVPITTAQRKLFGSRFQGTARLIIVQADSDKVLDSLIDPITQLLRQRHKISTTADNDFMVQNMTALANTAMQAAKVMSLVLGAIASISLIVGGIGIMNIMLVSVTERTREIGIRSALGAKRKDILLQFLLEAVVISLVGCAVGVLLGIGGALMIDLIFDTKAIISLQSILLSFMIAGGIGIFFGFYPARKAAQLKPIEALRYQ